MARAPTFVLDVDLSVDLATRIPVGPRQQRKVNGLIRKYVPKWTKISRRPGISMSSNRLDLMIGPCYGLIQENSATINGANAEESRDFTGLNCSDRLRPLSA